MSFARAACQPSLRLRLWLGALGIGLLAVSGAGLAVLGLTVTERRAEAALAAQARLEAWASLSTRISEWLLLRTLERDAGTASDAEAAVRAALLRLETLTAEDVAAAGTADEASQRAAEIRHVARMKSFFNQLSGLPQGSSGQAGIAFHLTHAPAVISARMEQESRRRDSALRGLEALRGPLRIGMAAFAVAAPLLLFLLWRSVLRPLLAGLRLASAQAAALNAGTPVTGPVRHDELGLIFARMRQAAARIARHRARLERDLSDLEGLVAARTAALSTANARLSAIDAARRRFFADVSHELRTPLTVILGEAELGAATADPELRQSFQTISARAERLFRRIEDLLRIAGSENGQLELHPRRTELTEVIRAAAEDVAPLMNRAGVTLDQQVPPGLSAWADADWLRQIFAGFFENSAKFAGPGAVIRLHAREEAGRVFITVEDNGAGPCPPPEAPLFDRHARSAPPGISGFGIGLALAHWAAEAMGGQLRRLPRAQGFALELELTPAEGAHDGPYSHS